MLGVAALATSAMDLLQSLTAKKTSSSSSASSKGGTGVAQGSSFQLGTPAPIPATAGTTGSATSSGNLSTSTMSALLDAQGQTQVSASSKTRSDALKSLFAQLDGNGDGAISKTEFEDKLGAGGTNVANADKVFAKLDKDGDGSLSVDELSKALKGGGKAPSGGGDSDSDGATTSTTVNADGSTTTAITYADGSTVTSTSAVPASSTAAAARTSYNAIEQMIAKQAQQISSAKSSLAISV